MSVGNANFVGIDRNLARYSPISSDPVTSNPAGCKLNFELSDHEIQPLSGSKAGLPDGDGRCGALLKPEAVQVTRDQVTRLCMYSARDDATFLMEVTLSDGIWNFVET
jgi:hypothetical protein